MRSARFVGRAFLHCETRAEDLFTKVVGEAVEQGLGLIVIIKALELVGSYSQVGEQV